VTTDVEAKAIFTYTIYIQATPEEVWRGLTDPDFTSRYWRHHLAGPKTFRSNWKQGSTYDLMHEEVGLVVSDPQQEILESDQYRRLAYSWHTFTAEWAAEVGMDETTADIWRAESRSKVAFDIEDTDTVWSRSLSFMMDSDQEATFSRPSLRAGPPCCRV
jgi:uncharacterized protein YndB with AHSA1/START domain